MKFLKLTAGLLPLLTDSVWGAPSSKTISVSDKKTNDSSPYLYGLCFEDLHHSGDGGIYAELLMNRAFQGPSVNLTGFVEVGGVWIQAAYQPLSDELPMSMRVSIPPNKEPEVGFLNSGWGGIDVKKGRKYKARFYAKTPKGFDGTFKVSLRDSKNKVHYADADAAPQKEDTLLYPKESNGFVHYEAELEAKQDAKNLLNEFYVILEDGQKWANQDFYFNIVSLFPAETYKGRENGLRKDVAEAVEQIGATMMRWPGANQLEGLSPLQRWRWEKTIGPLTDRPGRMGDWGYANTDGLGIHEYFDWCEDMKLEPILGVYNGLSLGARRNYVIPEELLQPYIDDVMNELEYCLGDENTKWGKERAKNGRKEPFDLKFVEIGNEDQFGWGLEYRFPKFHSAIKDKYPNLTLIASNNINITLPDDGTWQDPHFYDPPETFIGMFDKYDNYPRNNTPITVGEYQSNVYPNGSIINCPYLRSSVAEGVFMIGMERNSDQVVNSAPAPIIHNTDLVPNMRMFGFGAEYYNFTNGTTYMVQQMFASHKGDKILQLDEADFDPFYYVASLNTKKDEVYIKIANPTGNTTTLGFDLDVSGKESFEYASGMAITDKDPLACNCPYPYNQKAVQYVKPTVTVDGTKVNVDVGPHYAGVVVLK